MNTLALLACSDFFLSAANWQPGLRGLPALTVTADGLSVASVDDADDMVWSFPRPLLRAEQPAVRLWVLVPDLPPAPGLYFGFRVTMTDQYARLVWPGIFVGRTEAGEPWAFSRVLTDTPIAPVAPGWWTLALSWREDGLMRFHAAPGRVESPPVVAQDDSAWPTYMASVTGHFIALRQHAPAFVLGRLVTSATLPLPMLLPSREGVTLAGGYPGEPYELQFSADLAKWAPAGLIRDGETRAAADGFFRVYLP